MADDVQDNGSRRPASFQDARWWSHTASRTDQLAAELAGARKPWVVRVVEALRRR